MREIFWPYSPFLWNFQGQNGAIKNICWKEIPRRCRGSADKYSKAVAYFFPSIDIDLQYLHPAGKRFNLLISNSHLSGTQCMRKIKSAWPKPNLYKNFLNSPITTTPGSMPKFFSSIFFCILAENIYVICRIPM